MKAPMKAPVRRTKQKLTIEEEINNFNSFFDADSLYAKVIKKNNKIGIATVYRYLKSLVKEGKIHSYSCNRKTIYSSHSRNHCHFKCENCGKREHISLKRLDFIKTEIKGSVCHFQIDITGVCPECLEKKDLAT